GRVFSEKVLTSAFDEKRFPVKAAEFIARQETPDRLFTPDVWGGYLIYTLYPRLQLFMDDRHDFFGQSFLESYLKVIGVNLGWRSVLDKYRVNWILISPDSALSNTLKEVPDWKILYDDGVAVLFERRVPVP